MANDTGCWLLLLRSVLSDQDDGHLKTLAKPVAYINTYDDPHNDKSPSV
jgi:hypothetical protein